MKSQVEIGVPARSSCACGCAGEDAVPEIDVQTIPHAVRHAALLGALDSLLPGGALVLRATHDPVPLINQLEERSPGAFEITYRERGPESWAVLFTRR